MKKFIFGTATLIAFGTFLANDPAMAHQAVSDEDDGDAFLLNRQAPVDLEPVTKFEKTSAKFTVMHAFSGSPMK